MPVQVKCTFCNQSFDFDAGGRSLLATCPNCGRQTVVAAPGHTTQRLQILRNAPALDGGKPCPKCKAQIPRDAEICVHCGLTFSTGKSLKPGRMFGWRTPWLLLGLALLLVALAVAGYRLWPATEPERALPELVTPPIAPEMPSELAVRPEAAVPPPPPADELDDFEVRKARAADTYRQKLNEDVPLYRQGDQVELRLKTGRIMRGTLVLAGQGTNRVAILETGDGKTIIPYEKMDRNSRIRFDGKYREDYIRRTLKLPPAASMDPPAKQNQRKGSP